MNFFENLRVKKKNFFKKENFHYLILIFAIFFFDRLLKQNILKNFSDEVYFINDYINLDLIWNTGIGFGLLSSTSELYYNLVTILVGSVIVILVNILIMSDKFDKFIFSVIIGGAFGNFYDRLVYNAVPDFIDVHYNNFHWFTFNLADIFITIGIIAFLMKGFFVKN